jgi:uncharacterized protein with HEPN domain
MSRKSDIAKLERIKSLIDDVSQIGELLSKLESGDLIDRLPVREASAMRNVILHDYEGVNLQIVSKTLEQSLLGLRETVGSILSEI